VDVHATLTRFLKVAVGCGCLFSSVICLCILVSAHRASRASHSCMNLYPIQEADILNITIKSSLRGTISHWGSAQRERPEACTNSGALLCPDGLGFGFCPINDQFFTEAHAATALIQTLARWYLPADTFLLFAKDIGILQLSDASKVKFNVSTRSITLYSSHPCFGMRQKYLDIVIRTPSLLLMQLSHAYGIGGALVVDGDELLYPIQTPAMSFFLNESLNAAEFLEKFLACSWCTGDFALAITSAAVHKLDFMLEVAASTLLLAINAEIIHYATREIVIISIFASQMLQFRHSRLVFSRAIVLRLLNVVLTSLAVCVVTVLLMDELLSDLVTGVTLCFACLFKAASQKLNGIFHRQIFKIYLIHVSLIYAYVLQFPFPLIFLATCFHVFSTFGGYMLLVVLQERLDPRVNNSPPVQTVFSDNQHVEDQGHHQNLEISGAF